MKKILFSLWLISGSCALFAQQVQKDVPPAIQVQNNDALAGTVKYQQVGNDWWDVSYMNMNNQQAVNKSCNINGACVNVALPVMESNIPADVMKKIAAQYGSTLYDVTKVKDNNGQDTYVVRVLQNGQMITERVSEPIASE